MFDTAKVYWSKKQKFGNTVLKKHTVLALLNLLIFSFINVDNLPQDINAS